MRHAGREIVWTATAQKDFWDIIHYLESSWPSEVLNRFQQVLALGVPGALQHLLSKQPLS